MIRCNGHIEDFTQPSLHLSAEFCRLKKSYQEENWADHLPAYPPVDVGGLLNHLEDVAP